MVLGLTPVSANVLAVWPWRRNVITLRLTGFLMMELRNAHTSQGGFRGSVKECIQRAWNQLIHRWCWPLFYCCVCGCQGWWTERTTDAGGGGVGMQVGQEGTSQGGMSGAQWPDETRGLWGCSGTDRSLPDPGNCRRKIILLAAFLENPRTNSGRGWTEEESTYSSRKWSNRTQAIKRHSSTHRFCTHSHCVSRLWDKNSLDCQITTSNPTYSLCIF